APPAAARDLSRRARSAYADRPMTARRRSAFACVLTALVAVTSLVVAFHGGNARGDDAKGKAPAPAAPPLAPAPEGSSLDRARKAAAAKEDAAPLKAYFAALRGAETSPE